MMLSKPRLRRIDRAMPKEKPWKFSLREALLGLPEVPMVLAERARREAEAAGVAEKAANPAQPTVAQNAAAAPVPAEPQPLPLESQWWEERLGWQSRRTPPPLFHDDGVRYETIHEYDPLE